MIFVVFALYAVVGCICLCTVGFVSSNLKPLSLNFLSDSYIVITSAKEVMFSSALVSSLVCLLAGLGQFLFEPFCPAQVVLTFTVLRYV